MANRKILKDKHRMAELVIVVLLLYLLINIFVFIYQNRKINSIASAINTELGIDVMRSQRTNNEWPKELSGEKYESALQELKLKINNYVRQSENPEEAQNYYDSFHATEKSGGEFGTEFVYNAGLNTISISMNDRAAGQGLPEYVDYKITSDNRVYKSTNNISYRLVKGDELQTVKDTANRVDLGDFAAVLKLGISPEEYYSLGSIDWHDAGGQFTSEAYYKPGSLQMTVDSEYKYIFYIGTKDCIGEYLLGGGGVCDTDTIMDYEITFNDRNNDIDMLAGFVTSGVSRQYRQII